MYPGSYLNKFVWRVELMWCVSIYAQFWKPDTVKHWVNLHHMFSNTLIFLMLSNIRRVIRILKFPLVRILKCCPSDGHKNASHCGLGLYHPANEGEGMIEDEMVGWHHWFNRHELEHAPWETEGRGSLMCYFHVVTKSQTKLRVWTTTTMKERVEFYLCLLLLMLLWNTQLLPRFSFFFFFFVVDFVIHWNETAMGLHVFPIPIPHPTSLSTRSP